MADNTEHALQTSSLMSQIRSTERHWTWKFGIRLIVCIINIIAIGCAAYLVSNPSRGEFSDYYFGYGLTDPAIGALVVLCVSFLWCLIWVVLPFVLKPPRALHPGIAVGFDLVLWLAFIVAAIFALGGVFTLVNWSSDPSQLFDFSDGYANYSGHYQVASNNTLVYIIDYVRPDSSTEHYNSTTGTYEYDTVDPSTVVRTCSSPFTSCQQQDEFVNRLWRELPRREAITVLVNAVEWLDVLFHFALFVWACVDTHRHNRSKTNLSEKIVADRILADLEKRGLISVHNGVVLQASSAEPPRTATASASASHGQVEDDHHPTTTADIITPVGR